MRALAQTSMLSQSWLNGGGRIGGYCPASGFSVRDALSIALPNDTHATEVDHSKWAVAEDPQSHWWCALDNNHVESQETRSGLAVCLQHPALAALMRNVTSDPTPCGKPPTPPRPPGPSKCCYYQADFCHPGRTCCSEAGTSYGNNATCAQYGAKHHCIWYAERCVVAA